MNNRYGQHIVTGALMAVCAWAAEPESYAILPSADARFALEVHKSGLMSGKKHVFLFERYEGQLSYDSSRPEASSVRLVIQAASAVCQDTWVKAGQLKDIEEYAREDMLRVGRYPEIVFASREIRPAGNGRYKVAGDLTIRGVARPVTVDVEMKMKDGRLRFTGDAVVNLKDYGIKPRSAALGMIGTKNEMDVRFDLEAAAAGSRRQATP